MASSDKIYRFLLQNVIAAILLLLGFPSIVLCNKLSELTAFSIEELMNIKATSVSAVAVFVSTAEDIRRSRVMCFPEVLRIMPKLEENRFIMTVPIQF